MAKALKSGSLNYQRLSTYALQIDNYAVVRRLGYLCELMNININLSPPKSKKYLLLDPTMPSKGFNDPKWRLVINLDSMMLGNLE